MKKGLFITIEGGEGSGKTTLAKNLANVLNKDNINTIVTREPGGLEVAEKIRNVIMDYDITSKTEALLFAAARVEHLAQKVIPAIETGSVVISDRYIDSSLVYQGYARGLGIDKVNELNMWATDSYRPDLTFYLKLDPEVGLARINDTLREKNRFDYEALKFHNLLNEGYKKVFDNQNHVITIDASMTQDEILSEVLSKVMRKINE